MRSIVEALDRHAVERPRHAAVISTDGEVMNYAALRERAVAVQHWIEGRGCGPTIAISLASGPDFWCALLGTARSGRVPALVPCPLPGLVKLRMPRELGDPTVIDKACIDAIRAQPSAGAARVGAARGAILLSSGTTGFSRFVVRSSAAIDSVAAANVEEGLACAEDDIASFLPMAHAYGFEHSVLAPILAGATVRALGSFTIEAAAGALSSGATSLPTIPIAARTLVEAGCRAPTLRSAVVAGSPLPAAIRAMFEGHFRVSLVDLYGASELGTIWLDRGSGGRPVRGVEIRLDPVDGLAGSTDREIAVRSPSMLEAIIDRDGVAAAVGPSDWFRTGDLGRAEAEGCYRVTGRLKLVFDVGGLKVNPIEVEQALELHPAVRRALVQPVQVREGLHRVRASIELRSTHDPHGAPSAEELRAHLSPLVSAHSIPRIFDMTERLPETASGKLLREAPAPSASGEATAAIPPVTRRPKGLEQRAVREAYTKTLFDETARGYDHSSGAAFLRAGRWYRRRMLVKAGLRPGASHLDVGSGTGLCAAIGQQVVGPTGRVVALDPSTGMLEVAKKRGVREVVEGRAESLPFPDGTFDVVSMSYMLRHIEDLMLAFAEARRVLRPGGRIVIFEVTRPTGPVRRRLFDLSMYWVVPAVGVVASARPSTFPMMQYWAETIESAARPERIVEALDRAGFVGTRHLLELGVFSCYRGSAPFAPR